MGLDGVERERYKMTPRDKLLHEFDQIVDVYHASRQETRATLDHYAIGRWISVEERLPEFNEDGDFQGFVWFKGESKPRCDCFHEGLFVGLITYWLELDLPEKEEA